MMNEQTTQTQDNSAPKKKLLKFKFPKKLLILVVVLALLAAGIYFGRGLIVAAVVNGTPISRYAVISSLEKAQGESALDNLVTETLIKQEIKKANITVTQDEINQELANIESQVSSQGTTLDQALKDQNMTREQLIEQVTLQKQLEKLLSKDIVVTDEEIKDYIDTNSKYLPTDTTPEELNAQVKDQLTQQKLSQAYQTWITDVKSRAKILYFVNY